MSEENINVDVESPVVDTEAPAVAEDTTSYEYVDPSAFDGKYVKVKVDGTDIDVPFGEAIQGYQRQADYTRKTQELAAQREQLGYAQTLQQALETNPQETIDLLTRHYGVATANQMVADAQNEPQVPEFDDPLEKRIWKLNNGFNSMSRSVLTNSCKVRLADCNLHMRILMLRKWFVKHCKVGRRIWKEHTSRLLLIV